MAGETDRAAQSRAQKRRELLSRNINQTADQKYYKSGEASVIRNTAADKRGRPGDPPRPNPTPSRKAVSRDLVVSADKKYYANCEPQAPTREQLAQAAGRQRQGLGPVPHLVTAGRAAGKSTTAARHGLALKEAGLYEFRDGVPVVRVRTREEVNPRMEYVAELLNAGTAAVIVDVPRGELARRARAKIDMLVTSEVITEDQGRDVRYSAYDPAEEAPPPSPLPPPEPRGEKSLDEDEGDFLDPRAVLAGGLGLNDGDDGVSVAPDADRVKAEVDAEGNALPVEDEDDVDDFLAPGVEPPEVRVGGPEAAQPAARPDEAPAEDPAPGPTAEGAPGDAPCGPQVLDLPAAFPDLPAGPAAEEAPGDEAPAAEAGEEDGGRQPRRRGRRSGRGS